MHKQLARMMGQNLKMGWLIVLMLARHSLVVYLMGAPRKKVAFASDLLFKEVPTPEAIAITAAAKRIREHMTRFCFHQGTNEVAMMTSA